MDWPRFFAWTSFDVSMGSSTSLIFRYPVHLKDRFFAEFEGHGGIVLEQHPMFMHASFLERITTLTREVHFSLRDPMYTLQEELGSGPTCSIRLFKIARELTEYYRKMRQVKTDIDIAMGSTKELWRQTAVLANMLKMCAAKELDPEPSYELQMQLNRTFESVERELDSCAVYLILYSEKCNASMTIAHSLSNLRSAEVSTTQTWKTSLFFSSATLVDACVHRSSFRARKKSPPSPATRKKTTVLSVSFSSSAPCFCPLRSSAPSSGWASSPLICTTAARRCV